MSFRRVNCDEPLDIYNRKDGLLKKVKLAAAVVLTASNTQTAKIRKMQRKIDPKKRLMDHDAEYWAYETPEQIKQKNKKKKSGEGNQEGEQERDPRFRFRFTRYELEIGCASVPGQNPLSPIYRLPIESLIALKVLYPVDFDGSGERYKVVFVSDNTSCNCDSSDDSGQPSFSGDQNSFSSSSSSSSSHGPGKLHYHELTVFMDFDEQTRMLVDMHIFGFLDPRGPVTRGGTCWVGLLPYHQRLAREAQAAVVGGDGQEEKEKKEEPSLLD